MTKPPEAQFKKHIKKMVQLALIGRQLHSKLVWSAGSAFGGADTLDLTGVIAGHPVAIEVKRPDGKGQLTTRQKLCLREFHDAGAFAMVIEDDVTLQFFIDWIGNLNPRSSNVGLPQLT
jgi:hypothetical protein